MNWDFRFVNSYVRSQNIFEVFECEPIRTEDHNYTVRWHNIWDPNPPPNPYLKIIIQQEQKVEQLLCVKQEPWSRSGLYKVAVLC